MHECSVNLRLVLGPTSHAVFVHFEATSVWLGSMLFHPISPPGQHQYHLPSGGRHVPLEIRFESCIARLGCLHQIRELGLSLEAPILRRRCTGVYRKVGKVCLCGRRQGTWNSTNTILSYLFVCSTKVPTIFNVSREMILPLIIDRAGWILRWHRQTAIPPLCYPGSYRRKISTGVGTIRIDVVLINTAVEPRRDRSDIGIAHDHLPKVVDAVVFSTE